MRRTKKPAVQEIDRNLWEPLFRTFLKSETSKIDAMLQCLESRAFHPAWMDSAFSVTTQVRLHPPHLAALKKHIARRIHEAGGEYQTSGLTVRSSDGLAFTLHLPGG